MELCSFHGLCITNTFFESKHQHKVSWKHPRSHKWHQLDLVIARRSSLNNVLATRSYHSADCDTDHAMVCSKVRLSPRKLQRSKPTYRTRIDVARTGDPQRREQFVASLEQSLQDLPDQDATARWNTLSNAIYNAAITAFGKRERPNQDWFNANLHVMVPVIETKREALLAYKHNICEKTLSALRSARSIAKRTARRCANVYWLKLCKSIQNSADCGNKRMYGSIKKAVGPTVTKIAPLKSTSGEMLTDRDKQMERWVEHYSELYSRETVVTNAALNAIGDLPMMEELDNEPTIEDLSKAIDSLSCGKAPGCDSIPPEVVKCAKLALLQHLHQLLCLCSNEGAAPQEMRDATLVTLYKNKGDRSDCINYRDISLLSIVGKAFARVLLIRLQKLASRVYPESQCGFRVGRSTINMIFSVGQLQESAENRECPCL